MLGGFVIDKLLKISNLIIPIVEDAFMFGSFIMKHSGTDGTGVISFGNK